MGGSSKSATVGYKYYVGMHMVLCRGPVDYLKEAKVSDKLAISGALSSGSYFISKENLFGGESREGGVSGIFDVMNGESTQTVNSYLASKLGSLVPAFRGVLSVVFRQMYLGINPYLKSWSFNAQRIHVRQNGIAQWYDAKAEILTSTVQVNLLQSELAIDAMSATIDGSTGGAVFTIGPSDRLRIEVVEGTYKGWSRWPTDSDPTAGGLPWECSFAVKKNTSGSIAKYLSTRYANVNAAFAAAQANGPVDITGDSSYTVFLKDDILLNRQGLSLRVSQVFTQSDMNPAHIIRECLTDPDWGMGYAEADMDDASFTAAADTLYDERMGMSLFWDTQISIEEFVQLICKHINASIYVDRKTGLFVLKLIRQDYDEGALLKLTPSNVSQVKNFTRVSFGELVNSVTVTYWDSALRDKATITVTDIALVSMQGATINTSVTYDGFTNVDIASRVAQRDLKALSTPLISCTVYANTDAADLNIGDCFKLSWPDYDIDEVVMRVATIGYGDGKSNRVRLTCTQDVFAMPDTSYIAPTPPEGVPTDAQPVAVVERLAIEVPYLEAVQQMGQSVVDGNLATNSGIAYFAIAAGRPSSNSLNARLYTDAGAGYQEQSAVDFCPFAKLSSSIDRMATSFDVEDLNDQSEIQLGTWFQVGNEIMEVLTLIGVTITVKRGLLDTVPVAHSAGETLFFWDVYAGNDSTQYVSGETVSGKLSTVTGSGVLSISSAPADSIEMVGRLFKPYAPGKVQINGNYFPETVAYSNLILSWAHRDRRQQTGADYVGFLENSIGPETGTTYEVNIYNENGFLVHTETAISGTSFEWTSEEADSNLPVEVSTFTPATLFASGEKGFWLDASDFGNMFQDTAGTTPVTAVGQSVKLIRDKSGNSNHFTQETNAPTLQKDATGNYYLDFDGSSQFLTRTGDAALRIGTNNIAYCIGAKYDTVSGLSVVQSPISRSYAGSLAGRYWNGVEPSSNQYSAYQAGDSISQASASTKPTAITVISGLINRSVGTNVLRFDGTQVASNSFTSDSATNLTDDLPTRLGAYNSTNSAAGDSGSRFFDGRIYQAVVVYRNLSSAELTSLENYVAAKSQQDPATTGYRKNGKIRFTLESLRDGAYSFQKHDFTVERTGYGFNYGKRYGE